MAQDGKLSRASILRCVSSPADFSMNEGCFH
jgi:hypothetical protein